MGYYIQTPEVFSKAQYIAKEYSGEIIPKPQSFDEIEPGKALIVVLHNLMFEAAGFAFNEQEFLDFVDPKDYRFKDFVLINRSVAEALTGYKRD